MTVRRYDHEGRPVDDDPQDSPVRPDQEETLQQLLRRTETELKAHYPMMVDSATRLDSVTAEGDRLRYHYSLLNASVEELDVEATRSALVPMVQQQARSMSFLKLLLERGATITFHYKDKSGRKIAAIDVTAASQG